MRKHSFVNHRIDDFGFAEHKEQDFPVEICTESINEDGDVVLRYGVKNAKPFHHGCEGISADAMTLQSQLDAGAPLTEVPPIKPTAIESVRIAAGAVNRVLNDSDSFTPIKE